MESNGMYAKRPFLQEALIKLLDAKARSEGQRNHSGFLLKWAIDNYAPKDKNLTIVDIGAGTGAFLEYTSPFVEKKIAIDWSDAFKKSLETKGISFYKRNFEKDKLPLKDRSVDVILLSHIIEHIKNQKFFLTEVNRVLKPNGILILRTPDIDKVGDVFWKQPDHYVPFSKKKLQDSLVNQNFKVLLNRNFNYKVFLLSRLLPIHFLDEKLGTEILTVCHKP
jgi:2-polyprenyl-3-methyl-5-hydroxy-6-metoxy-1,4-benzoquinol methylase